MERNILYRVIDGRWTLGGRTFPELTLQERKALGERVSYEYPKM